MPLIWNGAFDPVYMALGVDHQQMIVGAKRSLNAGQSIKLRGRQGLIDRHEPRDPFGVAIGSDMGETVGMGVKMCCHGRECNGARGGLQQRVRAMKCNRFVTFIYGRWT